MGRAFAQGARNLGSNPPPTKMMFELESLCSQHSDLNTVPQVRYSSVCSTVFLFSLAWAARRQRDVGPGEREQHRANVMAPVMERRQTWASALHLATRNFPLLPILFIQ